MSNMEFRTTIPYAGFKLHYLRTIDNIDEAQDAINMIRARGLEACCTHDGDRHHLYAQRRGH